MREPEACRYQLSSLWRFEAPLAAVWGAIERADTWPCWWPGIEGVVTLEAGDALGVGACRCWTCKSVLPFRLHFITRVTRVEPGCLIEGRVAGELEGCGCCRLACDGAAVLVRHDWDVCTTLAWMNRLAPLARPLFRWNHDALMRAGGAGLARLLALR